MIDNDMIFFILVSRQKVDKDINKKSYIDGVVDDGPIHIIFNVKLEL